MPSAKQIADDMKAGFAQGQQQGWNALARHCADRIEVRRIVWTWEDTPASGLDDQPEIVRTAMGGGILTRDQFLQSMGGAGAIEQSELHSRSSVRSSGELVIFTMDVWGDLPDGEEISITAIQTYAVRGGQVVGVEVCNPPDHLEQGFKMAKALGASWLKP